VEPARRIVGRRDGVDGVRAEHALGGAGVAAAAHSVGVELDAPR
jgi:hypothetical protein